jgi:hypothetical protein
MDAAPRVFFSAYGTLQKGLSRAIRAAGAAFIPGFGSRNSGFAGSLRAGAQSAAAPARMFRIDTHAHFTIPKMYDLATAHGVQQATLKGLVAGEDARRDGRRRRGNVHHLDQRSRA